MSFYVMRFLIRETLILVRDNEQKKTKNNIMLVIIFSCKI